MNDLTVFSKVPIHLMECVDITRKNCLRDEEGSKYICLLNETNWPFKGQKITSILVVNKRATENHIAFAISKEYES